MSIYEQSIQVAKDAFLAAAKGVKQPPANATAQQKTEWLAKEVESQALELGDVLSGPYEYLVIQEFAGFYATKKVGESAGVSIATGMSDDTLLPAIAMAHMHAGTKTKLLALDDAEMLVAARHMLRVLDYLGLD